MGTRTPDIRLAKAALYQLSYDPVCFLKYSKSQVSLTF